MRDCWTDEEYKEVLNFVETYLWLFVYENAVVHQPKNLICNLFQFDKKDLRLLQIIYFLLSESVQRSVIESTPRLLRHLEPSTDRMTSEVQGSVRGYVDWNQTLKRRLGSGLSNPTVFVTRLPVKTLNIPEVQALKYLLVQINKLSIELLGNHQIPEESVLYELNQKWKDRVRKLYYSTNIFLKNSYLRDIEQPIKLTEMLLQRLRCARNRNFKSIYQSLKLYQNLFVKQKLETLKECFSQGVLKPIGRDRLYEVYILFITMNTLEQTGWSREICRLIGYGKGVIANYKQGEKTLRIYYQSLPEIFKNNSLYADTMPKYQINVKLRQPDMVFGLESTTSHFKLLEIKRTRHKGYIVDSFYKVLGYLKDFEDCFSIESYPHAIMIVWNGIDTSIANIRDSVILLDRHSYKLFINRLINLT